MNNKPQNQFLKNMPLKLLGIVLAILVWLILNNTQDPVITSSVTVPIMYDESGLEEKNMVAISKPTSISIPVKLHRSRLRYLSSDDFIVTVNLTEVIGDIKEAPEASKISMEIAKVPSATYIQSWEYPQSQGYIRAVLDTMKSAVYMVQFNTVKEPPEGYQLGTISCNPARVIVSGPTSAFSNLAAVKANIDLSTLTDNSTITANLALFDGNNRQLTASGLSINQSTVEVNIGLNQTKEISISIAGCSGTPAEGYAVSKVDYSPKLLSISGSKNALANISTISIPSTELDVNNATENKQFEISIKSYLPEGITLAADQSESISVTIEIEKLQTEEFLIDPDKISLINKKEAYEYTLQDDMLTLTLQALQADLDSFNPENLELVIDAADLSAGEHMIAVDVKIDSAYVQIGEVFAHINIVQTDNADDAESEQSTNTSSELNSEIEQTAADIYSTQSEMFTEAN